MAAHVSIPRRLHVRAAERGKTAAETNTQINVQMNQPTIRRGRPSGQTASN